MTLHDTAYTLCCPSSIHAAIYSGKNIERLDENSIQRVTLQVYFVLFTLFSIIFHDRLIIVPHFIFFFNDHKLLIFIITVT